MASSNCIKIICFLNIIFLVVIIIYTNRKSETNSFPPLVISSRTSPSTNISFHDERINQLLGSYSHVYEESVDECNTTNPLTNGEKHAFDIISVKLVTLRNQMISYPNEYFHGRGIVLTTGQRQLKFAKVNLKMLELTGTRLPVQVICVT